jgi:hypothetical protein
MTPAGETRSFREELRYHPPERRDRNPVQLLKQRSRVDLPLFPTLDYYGAAVRVSLLRSYGRAYAV